MSRPTDEQREALRQKIIEEKKQNGQQRGRFYSTTGVTDSRPETKFRSQERTVSQEEDGDKTPMPIDDEKTPTPDSAQQGFRSIADEDDKNSPPGTIRPELDETNGHSLSGDKSSNKNK